MDANARRDEATRVTQHHVRRRPRQAHVLARRSMDLISFNGGAAALYGRSRKLITTRASLGGARQQRGKRRPCRAAVIARAAGMHGMDVGRRAGAEFDSRERACWVLGCRAPRGGRQGWWVQERRALAEDYRLWLGVRCIRATGRRTGPCVSSRPTEWEREAWRFTMSARRRAMATFSAPAPSPRLRQIVDSLGTPASWAHRAFAFVVSARRLYAVQR